MAQINSNPCWFLRNKSISYFVVWLVAPYILENRIRQDRHGYNTKMVHFHCLRSRVSVYKNTGLLRKTALTYVHWRKSTCVAPSIKASIWAIKETYSTLWCMLPSFKSLYISRACLVFDLLITWPTSNYFKSTLSVYSKVGREHMSPDCLLKCFYAWLLWRGFKMSHENGKT